MSPDLYGVMYELVPEFKDMSNGAVSNEAGLVVELVDQRRVSDAFFL